MITICTILVASENRAGFIFGWDGVCKDCHGIINKIDNKMQSAAAPFAEFENHAQNQTLIFTHSYQFVRYTYFVAIL